MQNSNTGVEEVKIDSKARMVVVKGKTADPLKLCDSSEEDRENQLEEVIIFRKHTFQCFFKKTCLN